MLSVVLHISGTVHRIIFTFYIHVNFHFFYIIIVHMCKMIIFASIFFKVLIFRIVRRVKGKKWPQNNKKLCCALYLRQHIPYDLHLWYTCVKQYLQVFCTFFPNVKSDKKLCVLFCISGTIPHLIVVCGTLVK